MEQSTPQNTFRFGRFNDLTIAEQCALVFNRVNDYDKFAAVYNLAMGYDYAEHVTERYIDRLRSAPKGVIVDLACGSGAFLQQIEPKLDGPFIGIDLSKGQIAEAQKNRRGREISYLASDITKATLPEDCAAITCNLDAFNHLSPKSWEPTIEKIYQALQPKGLFLFDINTQERILNDWNTPEIIIKPGMTYIQVASDVWNEGSFLLRQLYMEAFATDLRLSNHSENSSGPLFRKGTVLVEQAAPPLGELEAMLRTAGFSHVTIDVTPPEAARTHIFLKNRAYIHAEK